MTNLVGASFLDSDINNAVFAGEICDETTILPNGTFWNENTNWSQFGAIDVRPSFINKPTKPNSLQYENDAQRQNDLKLLKQLWTFIKPDSIVRLNDETQYGTLLDDFYREKISSPIF